jgi:dTDP-4-dehydrorhamnose 3,5-epimerase
VNITPTKLADLLVIEPRVFEDERGSFLESWNRETFRSAGLDADFVQDNHSRSRRGVVRGLHYQLPNAQGKLVRVVRGRVWDVAVDIRRSSPTFGQWLGMELSGDNRKMLWIPEGYAHGFLTLEDNTEFLYKSTALYDSKADRAIRWNDPTLGIRWPVEGMAVSLSNKDLAAPLLEDAVLYD